MATDEITRQLLVEHRERCDAPYRAAGLEMPEDAFVFSIDGGVTPWNPDWVTHRIADVAKAAGVKTNIRDLRHYNATQLSPTASTYARPLAGSATAAAAPSRRGPPPPPGTAPWIRCLQH
jgi:integrase